jgi:squalene synthase HpnC
MPVPAPDASTREAFALCERLARSHHENFPVASLFIPRSLREHVAAIYAFARIADDFADEESLRPEQRLQKLDEWEEKLDACYAGRADHPVFVALRETVAHYQIPQALLADLLKAFRMDVTITRHATFADLRYYCRHSANPVGRLVLHLFGAASVKAGEYSDKICTALQLANFWQDLSLDWQKGRLYIPLEDLDRFGYSEEDLARKHLNDRFRALMHHQVDRTREMFGEGVPLIALVPRELKTELRLTWLGGQRILQKIEEAGYDVLTRRPTISAADKIQLVATALLRRNL